MADPEVERKFNPLFDPPTAEQVKIFEQFKASINTTLGTDVEHYDDAFYYRFLRARRYNMKESTKMLLGFVKWRKELGVIDFSDPKVNLVQRWGVYHFLPKPDKFGRPIVYMRMDHYNPNKRDFDGTVKLFVYALEQFIASMNGVERILVLMDLTHYSTKHNDFSIAKACLDVFQNYYPERLGSALIMNHPWIFMAAWKIIKAFLDKNTREKIHFLDNKKYKETLKKLIDIDNIPTDLGGNLTLPAPQIEAWSKDEKKKLKEQAATEEIEAEKNAGNFSPEPNE
jgi:hypothetical protein